MFSKLFGKKKHKEIEQKTSDIEMLGQPSGDGLAVLEEEKKLESDTSFR
jgi:hypothetical protein